MIISLVLTGKYNIGMSDTGTFNLNGAKQSIKDIPFIRYRFSSYGDEEIAYIKKMQSKFKYSAHLAEVTYSPTALAELQKLQAEVQMLCKFVYLHVTDDLLTEGTFPEEQVDFLYNIADTDITVDKYCLKDKTTACGLSTMNLLRNFVSEIVDTPSDNIAICSSPLSFNGAACLTAVTARELLSLYTSEETEPPVPSANHQCMNCCGCIKYEVISNDIAHVPGKSLSTGNKKKVTVSGEKKATVPAQAKPKGVSAFRW